MILPNCTAYCCCAVALYMSAQHRNDAAVSATGNATAAQRALRRNDLRGHLRNAWRNGCATSCCDAPQLALGRVSGGRGDGVESLAVPRPVPRPARGQTQATGPTEEA